MNKKTVLISGANTGIGKVAATELAKSGNTVVILCRDKLRGQKALKEIKQTSQNNDVYLMLCDLSRLSDIKNFVSRFIDDFQKLDVLINNAGVMNYTRIQSENDIELHWHVNYIAPYFLTNLLIDAINPGGRIINVTSIAHKTGTINLDDPNLTKGFSMFKAYSQSKLALVLFTYELARRLKDKGIAVNCVHPGVIISNLGVYKEKRIINYLTSKLKWLFCSEEKGAKPLVYLADSPDAAKETGKYYKRHKIVKSAKSTYDRALATKLWDYTFNLINEKITDLIR